LTLTNSIAEVNPEARDRRPAPSEASAVAVKMWDMARVNSGRSINNDVVIGEGRLAGKGIYAARDFRKGELVVSYNLKELTQAEFDALPAGEWEWTHSFWGRIYLFPEPGRYVNSDDNPTAYPDLERRGDYALRDIEKGEAITIDDQIELRHELETFLEAYEKAANSRDFGKVDSLVADNATFWSTNGAFNGKENIRSAFQKNWQHIQDETYKITDIQWIATNYWVSACTYKFKSVGTVEGKRQVHEGNGTGVLQRINGSWRIMHEHLSR
jgi:ketosteroid isomerase-like protein